MLRETRGRGSSAKATTPKMVSTKVKMASNKRLLEVLGLQGWPNAMLNDTLKIEGLVLVEEPKGIAFSESHTKFCTRRQTVKEMSQGLEEEEDVREGRIGRVSRWSEATRGSFL